MKPTQALHETGQSLWRGDSGQGIAAFAQAGIDTVSMPAELQRHGAEAFAACWQDLFARIGARHDPLARTA